MKMMFNSAVAAVNQSLVRTGRASVSTWEAWRADLRHKQTAATLRHFIPASKAEDSPERVAERAGRLILLEQLLTSPERFARFVAKAFALQPGRLNQLLMQQGVSMTNVYWA